MAKTKTTALRELGVSFGSVATHPKTRVGVRVPRAGVPLDEFDRLFCGKRISVEMLARSAGGPSQESIPGMDQDCLVTGSADVSGFSVKPKFVTLSLVCHVEPGDRLKLKRFFPKRDGVLAVLSSDKIPDDANGGDDDE